MGDLFLRYSPLMKVYSVYAKHFEEACTVFASSDFVEFVNYYAEERKLDINSLLALPMERLQRYAKMVKQLQSNTPMEHNDTPYLGICLFKYYF